MNMNSQDIVFDGNKETYIFIKELNTEVGLSLSDCLSAYYEELTEDYKNKIADFINHCDDWYDIATNAIQQRAKDIYHGNEIAQAKDLEHRGWIKLQRHEDKTVFAVSSSNQLREKLKSGLFSEQYRKYS